MGLNAPRFESIWKKLRKRGGGNAACLGVSRWACFPLLDSGFTPISVPIGQAGLGIFLVFRVKSLRFLFSEVEMGLSVLVSVSSVRWKSARKVGADCSASLPVPYGAAVTEQTVCTAACSSCQLLAVLGSVSCPSEARLEPLSWPPSAEEAFPCVLGSFDCDRCGGDCFQAWAPRCRGEHLLLGLLLSLGLV